MGLAPAAHKPKKMTPDEERKEFNRVAKIVGVSMAISAAILVLAAYGVEQNSEPATAAPTTDVKNTEAPAPK